MSFTSTRSAAVEASFSQALELGLAPDGGLFVPREWPRVDPDALASEPTLAALGARLLAPFLAGDALAGELGSIAREAFDFPLPLVALEPGDGELQVLELFHGPTAAFKDFGARFLAAALARLRRDSARPLCILVATSGDTGGAVAAAFHRRPGFEVVILFPRGRVSPLQELQLTTWGDNVRALAVEGSFDDCQRLAKEALRDEALRAERDLSSANSINLGRLLPQVVYYAWASLALARAHGGPASFVVPSGNLGNAVACAWARRLGLPVARLVLAHNANRTVPDFLARGRYEPRPSIPTLASAMDVGAPSNLERLTHLHPDPADLRAGVTARSVDDAAIARRIRDDAARRARVWCPHSAAAAEVHARSAEAERGRGPWVLVATAHPAKFPEIVEPLIGRPLEVPPSLARLRAREGRSTAIEPRLAALRSVLAGR